MGELITQAGFSPAFLTRSPRFHARASFYAAIPTAWLEIDEFFKGPNMIRNSGFHRRGDAQRLMDPAKVVVREWSATAWP